MFNVQAVINNDLDKMADPLLESVFSPGKGMKSDGKGLLRIMLLDEILFKLNVQYRQLYL